MADSDTVTVKNNHTAAIADVPAGGIGKVPRWVAAMFPKLEPQDGAQEPGEGEDGQEGGQDEDGGQDGAQDGFGDKYQNGMRGDRAEEYIASVEDPEDETLNKLLEDTRSTVSSAAAAKLRALEGL